MEQELHAHTDREILLLINERQKVAEKSNAQAINRLSDSIERVVNTVEKMDRERLAYIDERIRKFEEWKAKVESMFKTILFIATMLGTIIGWALNHFL